MGPLYPRMLRDHLGYAREVDALLEANGSGDRPQLPAAAERLARDVTVMGTYDEAPDAIRRWLEEGADRVDLVLPLGLGEGAADRHAEGRCAELTAVAGTWVH
jgi:alkanesulfonate monooxygenase SsuD/methylene tetrahydromethanopterin reductase-like flavin-dependent oxidoreductase (luciferase family)